MSDEEKKPYTYNHLEGDLQKLTEEEKNRPVLAWDEDSGHTFSGLMNDKQPYYINPDCAEDGVISQTDYEALDGEDKEGYEIKYKEDVTVLVMDF